MNTPEPRPTQPSDFGYPKARVSEEQPSGVEDKPKSDDSKAALIALAMVLTFVFAMTALFVLT